MSKQYWYFISLISLSGPLIWPSTGAIAAPMPLTQATLRKVVNNVKLLLNQQPSRDAKLNDRLGRGDALKTARASRAELKFNDGTLAKVGEYATFRFTPNTRRFDLQNGTYLFLVPPGRGTTEFYTPNARAGVRGSALFLRYDAETDTTMMGALTNNPLGPMDITVGNQKQDLYAGQMAIVVKNKIDRVETFDLRTFYNTSTLFKDVDLSDPEVQAVRREISDALQLQGVLQNGSAASQTPASLNPSIAASSIAVPIVTPNRPTVEPSIAQLREFPTINLLPVSNPIKGISAVKTPTATTDLGDTTTSTEPTPIVKAEPISVKTDPLPISVEPAPVKVEPKPIRMEPTPIKVEPLPVTMEPIVIKAEPKPIRMEPTPIKIGPLPVKIEPIVVKVEPKPIRIQPIVIVIPATHVTVGTPKRDVNIETPRVEIHIHPNKTGSGNSGIPTIEIPKFDAPKITETPKFDIPKVNLRPNITVDVPVVLEPVLTTIVTPIVLPVVQPIMPPIVIQDMPIVKPTIVEPNLIPLVPVTLMDVPIVMPTVTTPTPIVETPTPTPIVATPAPTPTPTPIVVTPTPTPIVETPTPTPIVVTPTPIVVTPTPTPIVVTPTPTPIVVTPTPTPIVVTPTPIVVTPTPIVVTPTPIVVTPTPIVATP